MLGMPGVPRLQVRNPLALKKVCLRSFRGIFSNQVSGATGSDFLLDVIQRRKSEYLALTAEQKRQLVEDFTLIRNTKHTARCTSPRSRINDITGTIKCVEDEVHGY